jgi:hypothetical protein
MRRRRLVNRGLGALALGTVTMGALVTVPAVGLALTAAPAGAASTSTLSHFLLKSNEQPGYTVGGRPTTMTTAAGLVEGGPFTAKQSKTIINELKQGGFVKAVEESTKSTGSNEGFSLVMEFSSPAGAQSGAALFLHIAQTGQAGSKPFTISGVSGAKGVTVTGSAGGSANAYWSAGDCAFGSGLYDGTAISPKAAAAPLETGIRSQAKRVGTTCP